MIKTEQNKLLVLTHIGQQTIRIKQQPIRASSLFWCKQQTVLVLTSASAYTHYTLADYTTDDYISLLLVQQQSCHPTNIA
jgi:hypothetical protein